MPPSSPSDDTPAWIKGDLPHDPPETSPEPAPAVTIEQKHEPETASPSDPGELNGPAGELLDEAGSAADLPAAAGEAGGADEPVEAPTTESLEAAIAERLAQLDDVFNETDEVLPVDGKFDEADTDYGEAPDAEHAVDDDEDDDDDAEEDDEDEDDELDADEEDEEVDDEEDVGVEREGAESPDAVLVVDASVVDGDDVEADEDDDEDEDEDDEPEDDDELDEGEGEDEDEDEDEDSNAFESAALDEMIVVELDEAETEPASDAGLPEAALLAELVAAEAELDTSLELTEIVIQSEEAEPLAEEAPAPAAASEAEPAAAPSLAQAQGAAGEAERVPGYADEPPTPPVAIVEALPPIEPPVVEDLSLEALIESLLFVADGAVPVGRLAEALEVSTRDVEAALSVLAESYQKRGLSVQRFREKVQLTTSPSAAAKVERFLGLAAATPLSRAALEALAIVAYQQPVTRPQIEAVRGVNSDSVIKNLLTKGLIEESGRAEGPGRPVLYSTTPEFMQHFGLTSLEDLPPLSLPSADSVLSPGHILKG